MDKLAFILGYTEGLDQLAKIAYNEKDSYFKMDGADPEGEKKMKTRGKISERQVKHDNIREANAESHAQQRVDANAEATKAQKAYEAKVNSSGMPEPKFGPGKANPQALATVAKYLLSTGAGGAAGAGVGYLAGDTGIGAGAGAGAGAALPAAVNISKNFQGGNWKAKALASLLTAGAGTAGAGAGYGVEQAVA
jgi:hypothetical protein